jgi:hypothetical protein
MRRSLIRERRYASDRETLQGTESGFATTDSEVETHFVASSMEAWIRGSKDEAPAPPITQVPVGVVDRKKDMTETLTRRVQKDTRWIQSIVC